jgi:hypothetical protein
MNQSKKTIMNVEKSTIGNGKEIIVQKGSPFEQNCDILFNGTNKHLAFRGTELLKQVK